jgi:hypothetical protein
LVVTGPATSNNRAIGWRVVPTRGMLGNHPSVAYAVHDPTSTHPPGNLLVRQRHSEIRLARNRDVEKLLVVLGANLLVYWALNSIID